MKKGLIKKSPYNNQLMLQYNILNEPPKQQPEVDRKDKVKEL